MSHIRHADGVYRAQREVSKEWKWFNLNAFSWVLKLNLDSVFAVWLSQEAPDGLGRGHRGYRGLHLRPEYHQRHHGASKQVLIGLRAGLLACGLEWICLCNADLCEGGVAVLCPLNKRPPLTSLSALKQRMILYLNIRLYLDEMFFLSRNVLFFLKWGNSCLYKYIIIIYVVICGSVCLFLDNSAPPDFIKDLKGEPMNQNGRTLVGGAVCEPSLTVQCKPYCAETIKPVVYLCKALRSGLTFRAESIF